MARNNNNTHLAATPKAHAGTGFDPEENFTEDFDGEDFDEDGNSAQDTKFSNSDVFETGLEAGVKSEPSEPTEPEPQTVQSEKTDWGQAFAWIADLPATVGGTFKRYGSQIKLAAALIAGLMLIRLALAMLDAINGIPLIGSLLELVGLAYIGWFTFQYLLRAESRRELAETAQSWKTQFLGES